MAASPYTTELIQKAKDHACTTLNFSSLKPEQSKALDSCLKQDTFISLPTGFGKSVIFQCAPICHDFIRNTYSYTMEGNIHHKSLVIVILPLKALALDQLQRAKELGLEAVLVMNDLPEEIIENLCNGKYSLLFASPEVLLSAKGKEVLQTGPVYDRICGMFVDESHCVVKWGQSSGYTAAFRKFYGMLAELRSIMKLSIQVVAMTATATTQVRSSTVKSLGMQNVALIHVSPVVDNIKHVVVKTTLQDPSEIFSWLCEELRQKKEKTERVIIFCQSRKDCSELYSTFCSLLPTLCWKFFNMFHTNTEGDVQGEIAADFGKSDGTIRVLFATIAFGLGVDVKGVSCVIMYGCPPDIDDYVQLCGRAGRDGRQSVSVILKSPASARSGRITSTEMKKFCDTTECRRDIVHHSFPADREVSNITPHNCCDNCAAQCMCSGSECCQKPHFVEESLLNYHSTVHSEEIPVRVISEEDYFIIKQELYELQCNKVESFPSDHLYSGADIVSGLSSPMVGQLLSNIHLAFTYSQFCERFQFSSAEVLEKVWFIFVKHLGNKPLADQPGHGNDSSDEDEIEEEEAQALAEAEYQEACVACSDSESD